MILLDSREAALYLLEGGSVSNPLSDHNDVFYLASTQSPWCVRLQTKPEHTSEPVSHSTFYYGDLDVLSLLLDTYSSAWNIVRKDCSSK